MGEQHSAIAVESVTLLSAFLPGPLAELRGNERTAELTRKPICFYNTASSGPVRHMEETWGILMSYKVGCQSRYEPGRASSDVNESRIEQLTQFG